MGYYTKRSEPPRGPRPVRRDAGIVTPKAGARRLIQATVATLGRPLAKVRGCGMPGAVAFPWADHEGASVVWADEFASGYVRGYLDCYSCDLSLRACRGLCVPDSARCQPSRRESRLELTVLPAEAEAFGPWVAALVVARETGGPVPAPPLPVTDELAEFGLACRYLWSAAAWANYEARYLAWRRRREGVVA